MILLLMSFTRHCSFPVLDQILNAPYFASHTR